MKRISWQMTLGLSLVALSIFFYFVHYFLFHDPHHILIYLVGDIAFVPIEVLLVTLIIHRILSRREKRTLLHKLNMVIGIFFSEVGTALLKYFSQYYSIPEEKHRVLLIQPDWTKKKFLLAEKAWGTHELKITSEHYDLNMLKAFLLSKRSFMLGLLENPNLLEHDQFTDLLWAVFHFTEELGHRKKLKELPKNDYRHLSGDMIRVYRSLIVQWLAYMQHLKESYPYLFSLALRTNPFDEEASPEIR
jgi:hypothetical protein